MVNFSFLPVLTARLLEMMVVRGRVRAGRGRARTGQGTGEAGRGPGEERARPGEERGGAKVREAKEENARVWRV